MWTTQADRFAELAPGDTNSSDCKNCNITARIATAIGKTNVTLFYERPSIVHQSVMTEVSNLAYVAKLIRLAYFIF